MTGRHRAAFAVLLVIAAVIAVEGCLNLADGHLVSGVLALAGAGLAVVCALLTRLNWQILALNRELIDINRDLLERFRNKDSRPHP